MSLVLLGKYCQKGHMLRDVGVTRYEGGQEVVSQMSTHELYALLANLAPTDSFNYLVWAISQAAQGTIPQVNIAQDGEITLKIKFPPKETA